MRELFEPHGAAPDAALAAQRARLGSAVGPVQDGELDRAERLRRRDQLVHSIELSRRLRRRRLADRTA
jgi:hypothetical protein